MAFVEGIPGPIGHRHIPEKPPVEVPGEDHPSDEAGDDTHADEDDHRARESLEKMDLLEINDQVVEASNFF